MAFATTTLATIGAVASVAGAGIAAVGAIQQGAAQQKAFAFQAAVQRQQAERERQIAAAEESKLRSQQSAILASRRARLSAAGVDPSLGTALLGTEAAAGRAELDALMVRAGGLTRENALLNEANISQFRGASARQSSFLSAGSTLLGGLARGAAFAADARGGGTRITEDFL
jgi:hypothetical protein